MEIPEWLKGLTSWTSSAATTAGEWRETVATMAGKWSDALVAGAKRIVAESRRIDEEGTPLRGAIRMAREATNALVADAYRKYVETRATTETHLADVAAHTLWLQDLAAKAEETRQAKPEILVAAATLSTAALSVFASRTRLITNTLGAALATSAAVYGSKWWQDRPRP